VIVICSRKSKTLCRNCSKSLRSNTPLNQKDYSKTTVCIVGAGPAGLACAISLRCANPATEVCVIEKAADLGNHNLSGAVLEPQAIHRLLNMAAPGWRETDTAKDVLGRTVTRDQVLFLWARTLHFNISFSIRLARLLGLGFGQLHSRGDYIVSISKLTRWLGRLAANMGVEVITGFSVEDIIWDEKKGCAAGVKLVDQGRDKHGDPQPNFVPGETVKADIIVLAEGCDGLVTERFVEKANLARKAGQLYSIGIKEVIKVSPQQYERFGDGRVVHALGYPLWTPLVGPGMFGGGVLYSYGDNQIMAAIIVGADWKYRDFNPQDALVHFKNHRFIRPFVEGGQIVEAGAKMIPEGGLAAIPRDPRTGAIGKANVLILGDSAGFVNMLKIKGLHNAIESGLLAGQAIAATIDKPCNTAVSYTELLENSGVAAEMQSAKNFRQTVAEFGPLQGMPVSILGGLLPAFDIEPDYTAMTARRYKYKGNEEFDKATFTALAGTAHREEQPCHLILRDNDICQRDCAPKFGRPCITFCPAGVYETIGTELKPANPSNCLHCKTCQRKCPFDNIRWTAPEGAGGPRYKFM
jgi:electron-transferring-flavoprotein dehydrogenase